MISLKDLRDKNPEISELLLESQGFGLWTVWQGEGSQVIAQTLEEYGGIEVLQEKNQALWFFFSIDVFLAVAKLGVWAQFNPLPVTMQVFKAEIKCSHHNEYRIELAEDLWQQSLEPPLKFQVYASAEAVTQNSALSSITMNETATPPGFSARTWHLVVADPRLAYKPLHSWYCVLKPIVVHQDKNFLIGWRDFYEKIEHILSRNKLRHTVHDNTLMMPLGSLRQLKQWCREYLTLIGRLKNEEGGGAYWPCVMAFRDSKGISFNNDLPRQFELDWNSLMPDSPYMSLKDAVLLGHDFEIHESHLAMGKKTHESWCSVSLATEESTNEFAVPALAPGELIFGEHRHCFYCGQRSHPTAACPSKRMLELDSSSVWNKVAACDFKTMKDGVAEINRSLEENPEALEGLLLGEDLAALMTRAIFGVCANLQWRAIPIFWKLRGKQYPNALKELRPEDDSPVWPFIHSMQGRDLEVLDKELQTLQVRFPRDYRVFSIYGFVSMERGDFKKARECWEQAHLLSHPGVMQAWHFMLLGRLAEYQGDYNQAMVMYEKMQETTPSWSEAKYRRLVCMIKSGFISRAEVQIRALVREEPNYFNWFLLDPEVERGAAQLLSILSTEWKTASERLGEEKGSLELMRAELHNWFTPENEFLLATPARIEKYKELSAVQNFVPYMMVIKGRAALEKDMQARIAHDMKNFKNRFKEFVGRLALVRDEAAWFPFPRVLVEFNRNYNSCAANLNWVLRNNMHTAEVFKKAQELSEREEERIKKLEKRMKFLRIIRDGTLFSLIVIRKFLWMEIIGLALILAVFPLLLYYGEKAGFSWISTVLVEEQWQIQKAAILIVSMMALSISGFWTVLRFEEQREKTFEKARRDEARKAALRAEKMEKLRRSRRAVRRPSPKAPVNLSGRESVR